MKASLTTLVGILAISLASGCSSGTSGGPGATTGETARGGPFARNPDDTFQIVSPGKTVIRQGETKTITIPIERTRNFDEDVMIEINDLPKGVSIDLSDPVIEHGETQTELKLTADDDAALGDFSVEIIGHPSEGADATNRIDLTITNE